MSRRQVPVNWADLETALTADAGEMTCYLDVRTGEVHMPPAYRSNDDDAWPSEDDLDQGLAAGHLIHIEPLGSGVEYGWTEEFAATVGDAKLRDMLDIALDGSGAFRRFKNVLLDFPEERERWFAFRDERLYAAARERRRSLRRSEGSRGGCVREGTQNGSDMTRLEGSFLEYTYTLAWRQPPDRLFQNRHRPRRFGGSSHQILLGCEMVGAVPL
jgi:hypothetical protein